MWGLGVMVSREDYSCTPSLGPRPRTPWATTDHLLQLAGVCTLVSPCLLTQCPLNQLQLLRLPLSSCHQVPGFLPH